MADPKSEQTVADRDLSLARLGFEIARSEGDELFSKLVDKGRRAAADLGSGSRSADAARRRIGRRPGRSGGGTASSISDVAVEDHVVLMVVPEGPSVREVAHSVAGEPLHLLTAEELRESPRVRVASEAIAKIWEEPMLESSQAALALGAKETNREKVRALRQRSWLLGLPRDRGYLYPAFQIDVSHRETYPEVREVNELLGAEKDPWGVASWWMSKHDRLGARPVDLVGSARSADLIEVARAVSSPVG